MDMWAYQPSLMTMNWLRMTAENITLQSLETIPNEMPEFGIEDNGVYKSFLILNLIQQQDQMEFQTVCSKSVPQH